MKILFIQKEGGIFGAENYHLKTIPALIQKGFKIEFLRLYTDYQGGIGGDFVDRLRSFGVEVYEVNIGRLPTISKLVKINKVIKSGKYDIIHTHLIHADLYLSLIKVFWSIPCKWVSTKHGYDNNFTAKYGFDHTKQKTTFYFEISKFSEKLVDRSFTISNGLRDFFIKTGLTKADKMELIHYGFDFDPPLESWENKEFKKFKKQIFIAGRLVAFKGHKYLIDALPAVIEKYPDAGLLIAGTGTEEENIKRQLKDLNIEGSVELLGYSSEVSRYMYNSDLVVVPSISEGFGVVFLEAFNCSKPVVAFNVPSGNEIIEDNITGYLARPYSSVALAEKIIHIFDNPEEAEKLGNNANQKLVSYFNLSRMVEQTSTFYQSLV